MEPEGSLPHSQAPASCPYTKPDQSSSCPQSHFFKIHFNNILPYTLGLPNGLFPSGLPAKTLYAPFLSPICATCPAIYIIYNNSIPHRKHSTPFVMTSCLMLFKETIDFIVRVTCITYIHTYTVPTRRVMVCEVTTAL